MKTLFKIYWNSDSKKKGYLYLLGIILMVGLTIAGTVYLNEWRSDFYNAIDAHRINDFWVLIVKFTAVASGLVVVYAYSAYITQLLGLDWRIKLTEYFENKWLEKHKGGNKFTVDNPDQRISEDIRKFIDYFLNYGTQLVQQFILLLMFSVITYQLSSELFGIPGLLLWISLGYALIGSFITWRLGKPLIKIEFETQKREADYRYGLALEREHNIDKLDIDGLSQHTERFISLREMVVLSFKRQKIVNFFVSSYNQIEVIIPFLFIAPSYFASALTLGWLMQTAQSMSMVQQSIAYIVNNYTGLAQMKATIDRLTVFNKQLEG
jgi:putative ATP-binding cassette transporter